MKERAKKIMAGGEKVMKKKLLVALGIGIVVIAGAGTVYATRSQKAKSSSDQAYELGQMIQERIRGRAPRSSRRTRRMSCMRSERIFRSRSRR